MDQKALHIVAAFLISGCSYGAQAGALDGPYAGPYAGLYADPYFDPYSDPYAGSPSNFQPVAYTGQGQPLLAEPLYIEGVPVSFYPVDDGVYELVDPDGYVIGYAYLDGIDRLRITNLDGQTLYFLHYDGAGYFRAFNPQGVYLSFYSQGYLSNHFNSNRHRFNAPFLHSGSKARKHFRSRANKHRKARLRDRARHHDRRFSSRGHRERDAEKRRHHRDEDRFDRKRKKPTRGSGWKPVHNSDQASRSFNASPRGLNTGGAVFKGDFPFQPQVAPKRDRRGKGERSKTKHNPRGKSERRKTKQRAHNGKQRRQQQAQAPTTQAAPAPQSRPKARRNVNAPPPAAPPQTARNTQTTQSSEPNSKPARSKARSERARSLKHRSGTKNNSHRR